MCRRGKKIDTADGYESGIKRKMSITLECDCPWCPLVKDNVQVCDVIVYLNTGRLTSFIPLSEEVRKHLFTISIWARNNQNLKKKGRNIVLNKDDFDCCVECLKKDTYKVCFHAKQGTKIDSA